MAKNWYVLHTYSGYEKKIERTIQNMKDEGMLSEAVIDVKVPERVEESRDGKKTIKRIKFLPGYLLMEMELPDSGWREILSVLQKINGVTGFVGSSANTKPRPISQEEARNILQEIGEIKGSKTEQAKSNFRVGETVRITDGPFATFTGSVENVNMEKAKLRVTVGIFGRSTPVELDFVQVEKV